MVSFYLDRIYPAMRGAGMDVQDIILSFNLSRRKFENQIASREGKWSRDEPIF